jgi:hypothetical protein
MIQKHISIHKADLDLRAELYLLIPSHNQLDMRLVYAYNALSQNMQLVLTMYFYYSNTLRIVSTYVLSFPSMDSSHMLKHRFDYLQIPTHKELLPRNRCLDFSTGLILLHRKQIYLACLLPVRTQFDRTVQRRYMYSL